MTDLTVQEEIVFNARKSLVIKYRQSPSPWPDGIDSKWDRWYRPEEWDDQGNYSGPLPMPKRPDPVNKSVNIPDPPKSEPVNIVNKSNTEAEPEDPKSRNEYHKGYMRDKRAAEKALKGKK